MCGHYKMGICIACLKECQNTVELIREIQKIPTTLISESFWMKILPLNLR